MSELKNKSFKAFLKEKKEKKNLEFNFERPCFNVLILPLHAKFLA